MMRNLLYATGSMVGAVGLIVLFFRFAFPLFGKMVSGPYLASTLGDAHAAPESAMSPRCGECGIVETALRPSGKALFGATVYDVVADGGFIDKGEKVVVSEVAGGRIVVTREQAS